MDNLRIAGRNIFYRGLSTVRRRLDNYRDDHELYRRLTRSVGVIVRTGSTITVTLHPNMELGNTLRASFEEELIAVSASLTERIRAIPDHPIRQVILELTPAPE